jgi:hypothetical protein
MPAKRPGPRQRPAKRRAGARKRRQNPDVTHSSEAKVARRKLAQILRRIPKPPKKQLSLGEHFEAVKSVDCPAKRGRDFEDALIRLLESSGFEPTKNPRAAAPRQTDVYASFDKADYLVEARWQHSAADVADLDGMRSRLGRTPADLVGLFFSVSGYTGPLVQDLERNHTREILLFNELEITALFGEEVSVQNLIRRKREELRRNSKVWLCDEIKSFAREQCVLPRRSESFLGEDGAAEPLVHFRSAEELAFCRFLPDIGWPDFGGNGVGLRLRLDVSSVSELRAVLGILHSELGLANKGSFLIHQTTGGHSWCGAGALNFLRQIPRWRARYGEAGVDRPHHSEELTYIDRTRDGLLAATLRQRVGRRAFLHSGEVTLRIPGIPVGTSPYVDLCSASDNALAHFCPVDYKTFFMRRLAKRHRLVVASKIVDLRGSTVTGIVAKNPFLRKRAACEKLTKEDSPLRRLYASDLLVCSLKDIHSTDDDADYYYLTMLAGAWVGGAMVLYPVCTWNELKK